jgi:hypothetical protein
MMAMRLSRSSDEYGGTSSCHVHSERANRDLPKSCGKTKTLVQVDVAWKEDPVFELKRSSS